MAKKAELSPLDKAKRWEAELKSKTHDLKMPFGIEITTRITSWATGENPWEAIEEITQVGQQYGTSEVTEIKSF